LLLWRDNNWAEMEEQLVEMLGVRDRWMHGFVLEREPDWEGLRERLERPFARAVRDALTALDQSLSQLPGACEEALELARFGCAQTDGILHRELAELADFPTGPFRGSDSLEEARTAYLCLSALLLTGGGTFRKAVNKSHGFPADRKREKQRMLDLIDSLRAIPGLEASLASVPSLPPIRYTDDEWAIVRACFTVLARAAAELRVVFAEAGTVDFIEVAQIAQRVLQGDDGWPTDAAIAVADGIRHLLVDEFQDTSRRQHQLLASLIAAWDDRAGRTGFAVGDPMQSIYFFRDADAELFPRVTEIGLEIPNAEPFLFEFVPLEANFRTAAPLVNRLNEVFEKVFAGNDGSGVGFASALPAREDDLGFRQHFELHLDFVERKAQRKTADSEEEDEREAARDAQAREIVALIESHMDRVREAQMQGGKYRIAVLGRARTALAPIAAALHEAAIPFRAVDLESLSARPEVLDALSLARALLNPYDRVAWLGVLRAPWCGLALDDLHTLVSADDRELMSRPVSELLAERRMLLSEAGRHAAGRVLDEWNSMPALRAAEPTTSTGTWLQQVWLRLGGGACVDATGRANLDLLWSCLDKLPAGEPDLLGPALKAALAKLTALPDPDASGDAGVQLMTIHKSKGLEFEVVIVPDMQAGSMRGTRKMLSWLERGLAEPDESGDITEFLIAPFQPKGADRSTAKKWVDEVYNERESQETRRILYVAATRAREELHLFARPSYKVESNGEWSLNEPKNSLLATAWPALEDEVRARFDEWKAAAMVAGETEIESIAASGESNLLVMPTAAKPTLLHRLPLDYEPMQGMSFAARATEAPILGAGGLYARHEGGLLSRALGNAVHMLLEELTRLRGTQEWEPARAALRRFEPRMAAEVRAKGVEAAQAASIAAEALRLALAASHEAIGQWILSPHTEAASEASWAGMVAGNLRTVRVDRVFKAGRFPIVAGADCWWIVDYKTAHTEDLATEAGLPRLRDLFAPQIEAYAQVLRNLHGDDALIRAGLYYPRMLAFDWWEF
jgi:ATP-dependent exoDNAse (exonuclease V) beta subunit